MQNKNHYGFKSNLPVSLKLEVMHIYIFISIPKPFIVNNAK
jgi:hypothetical protein